MASYNCAINEYPDLTNQIATLADSAANLAHYSPELEPEILFGYIVNRFRIKAYTILEELDTAISK